MDVEEPSIEEAKESGGGDLFERLEALDKAETLPAEDDLILRMSAVSKLRGKRAGKKEKSNRSSPSKFDVAKPQRGISKKKPPRQLRGGRNDESRVSNAAISAASVVSASLRSRSKSI